MTLYGLRRSGRLGLAGLVAISMAFETRAEAPPAESASFTVEATEVDDLKSVYATVRSRDLTQARVRTPGTITTLSVDEGDLVKTGQILAQVADPKIALTIKGIEARIVAARSRLETAKSELDRAKALFARGVSAQSRVDQAQTSYDVAENDLKAARADLSVTKTQIEEGDVLAPADGRVLKVPVTEGSVVMPGEAIATIAANTYLLRLELPERQARFIKEGDIVRIAGRSLKAGDTPLSEGRITQVYPEVQNGRVIADAEAPGLDTFFIGERVLVWLSAGKREAILVPRRFLKNRYGVDFVRIAAADGKTHEVVVQIGPTSQRAGNEESVEILTGLTAGDRLVQP
jgi:RND family efflux transporter MFP subunit